MTIRKIKEKDLLACSKLLERAYELPPHNETFKGSTALGYVKSKYNNCKENSFVAVNKENEIIGFIFLSISSWGSGLQAILEEVVVNPNKQNIGVGKELLECAHSHLKSLDVKSIMLWARKDSRLLGFYEKQGYSLADDFIVMFKDL